MTDTTVKKVSAEASPEGAMGQTYLVSGKRIAMRLWSETEPTEGEPHARDYETVGYAVSGRAEVTVEGQTLKLEAGDSWLVPAGATRSYRITEPFTAIEATSPPARVAGDDAPSSKDGGRDEEE